jgi:oxygen-independent coproporphyrinogen-3 oxidase
MLQGLQAVVASGIRHITHYELNIAGRSDFALHQKDKVPTMAQKLEMYLQAHAYLSSEGYVQRTVYDWERPDPPILGSGLKTSEYRYEQNLRDGVDPSEPDLRRYMCGFGHSAINVRAHRAGSGVPSVSVMNHRSLSRYAEALQRSEMPVERFYIHEDEDVRLLWLFQSLQEMAIDLRKYQKGFGQDFRSDFGAEVDVLVERGWAAVEHGRLVLSRTGGFYVPLLQTLLAHRRVEVLQRRSAQAARRTVIPIASAATAMATPGCTG